MLEELVSKIYPLVNKQPLLERSIMGVYFLVLALFENP